MNLLRALLIAISCTIPLKQSACWEIPGASWVYDQFHILQLSHHFPADMAPQGTPIYTDPA
ncbi:hypothetical protein FJ364_04790, partial [Candidatus Dependentiae bacterium]|nr:hypothetical protein [Candidatus Dependentiae bacterium]